MDGDLSELLNNLEALAASWAEEPMVPDAPCGSREPPTLAAATTTSVFDGLTADAAPPVAAPRQGLSVPVAALPSPPTAASVFDSLTDDAAL